MCFVCWGTGSFWARWDNHPDTVNAKEAAFFKNDEASSVLIQGPIRKGEVLHIWDSPDGGDHDDHTRIEVMSDMELGDGYCVGSFEDEYDDGTVRVSYLTNKVDWMVKFHYSRTSMRSMMISMVATEVSLYGNLEQERAAMETEVKGFALMALAAPSLAGAEQPQIIALEPGHHLVVPPVIPLRGTCGNGNRLWGLR